MTDEQKSTVVEDPFGLESEFEKVQTPQVNTQQFSREIEIGGQVVRIEARTQDELFEKALAAKDEFYRSRQAEPQIDSIAPDESDYKIPELSADEEQAMGLNWGANPSGYVRRLIEVNF